MRRLGRQETSDERAEGDARRLGRAGRGTVVPSLLGHSEELIYLVVGTLLVVAAGFTLVATVEDVISGAKSRAIGDTGVFLLDRVLLLFIIAELLYTLRLVDFQGRMLVEPFLFIGLIAVVRRILVITAEIEGKSREQVDQLVVQLGVLAGLMVVLAGSIYLLRKGGVRQGSASGGGGDATDGQATSTSRISGGS